MSWCSFLEPIDLVLMASIGGFLYFLYLVPPLSMLLQRYYTSYFQPLLLLGQIFFSVLLFISIEYFFIHVHHQSLFSLSLLDQVSIFAFLSLLHFCVVGLALPFFPIKTTNVHEVEIYAVRGSYADLFTKAVMLCHKLAWEVVLELPDKHLIIAQTPEIIVPGTAQTQAYVIEITFSEKPTLWQGWHVHFLCYPAHKRAFVEKKDMKDIVHKIGNLFVSP